MHLSLHKILEFISDISLPGFFCKMSVTGLCMCVCLRVFVTAGRGAKCYRAADESSAKQSNIEQVERRNAEALYKTGY